MNLMRSTNYVIALFIALFVALVVSQADKSFVLDELDFPIVAKATSETWKPVYYRGEENKTHLGLYHPPLYIYLLGAYVKFFGFSENTVRTFGLFCTLLTALMTAILGSRISPRRSYSFIPIFFALYLSNPYTVANTTLPDIDQSILPPLITLYLIFLFDNRKEWILAVVFTLLLWAKLTTPLVLIPFSLIYWYSGNGSVVASILRCIRVFVSAIILFVISYFIYCKLTNLPFGYTFDFLLHSFSKGSGATELSVVYNKIAQNYTYSSGLLEWMMYPFVLLFFLSLILSFSKYRSDSTDAKILGLGLLTTFVTLFYCGLIAPFGGFFKYPFPVFQLACLVISMTISSRLGDSALDKKSIAWFGIIVAVSALAFQAKYLGDHRLVAKFIESVFVNSQYLVILLLIVAALWSILSKKAAVIILSLLVGGQVGLAVGVSRTHAVSVFPTKYNYGQLGFDDTVGYLKQKLEPGEVVWSMKDIGYYSGNKYIESYSYYFDEEVEHKIMSLSSAGVRYFVATKDIGEDRLDASPKVSAALDNCCILEKNFGNYYIYRKK